MSPKPEWMRGEKRHTKTVKTTVGRKRRMEMERERIVREAATRADHLARTEQQEKGKDE